MQTATTPTTRLIRLREVMTKTGLSKSSVYRLTDQKKFPSALALSDCAKAWRESDVDDWINSRQTVTAPMKPAPNRKAAS